MIRLAKAQDLAAVVEIYNQTIACGFVTADVEPVTVESREAWFYQRDAQRPIWVYEVEGVVAGWLSLSNFYGRPAYRRTAEISVYVHDHYKQQGIAKALIALALDSAPELGIHKLLAFVFGQNAPSMAMLQKQGFKRAGFIGEAALVHNQLMDLVILEWAVPE